MITQSDFTINVGECIDSEDWYWEIRDAYNGVRLDGVEATEAEAWAKAKKARKEEIEYLNSDPTE